MTEAITIDRHRRQACLSTAIQKARDRQRVGTGASTLIVAGPTSASSKPKA